MDSEIIKRKGGLKNDSNIWEYTAACTVYTALQQKSISNRGQKKRGTQE
jgi:hypothetical protein